MSAAQVDYWCGTAKPVASFSANGGFFPMGLHLSAADGTLTTAPASASASGIAGEVRVDADYIYVCTATNTWKRVAIST